MSGVHYITEPQEYLEPKITKTGFGAIPAKTVIEVFQETVRKHGDRPAMCYKRSTGKVGNSILIVFSVLKVMDCRVHCQKNLQRFRTTNTGMSA
jgi:hypothetical protein